MKKTTLLTKLPEALASELQVLRRSEQEEPVGKPTLRQINNYDETGKLVSTVTTRRAPSPFGRGWVTHYKAPLRDIARDAPIAALRVWCMLTGLQNYEEYVAGTVNGIAQRLRMSRATAYVGFAWLTQHHYLQPIEIDGNSYWLLNPHITACGSESLKGRRRLWDVTEALSPIVEGRQQLNGGANIEVVDPPTVDQPEPEENA